MSEISYVILSFSCAEYANLALFNKTIIIEKTYPLKPLKQLNQICP